MCFWLPKFVLPFCPSKYLSVKAFINGMYCNILNTLCIYLIRFLVRNSHLCCYIYFLHNNILIYIYLCTICAYDQSTMQVPVVHVLLIRTFHTNRRLLSWYYSLLEPLLVRFFLLVMYGIYTCSCTRYILPGTGIFVHVLVPVQIYL
jgi:hypothetical protein